MWYIDIKNAFFIFIYVYCPCRLRCMLGNSFSWACSVVHQRFTHTKYLWLFGYFPSPLNKTIDKNILIIISNERNFFTFYLDSFWMQCLDPKHDCIWCINQSTSQTVDWKIKVEREKKNTAHGDIIITPESKGMPTIGSSTVTIKSSNNRQQNFTKPDTSWWSKYLGTWSFSSTLSKKCREFYAQKKSLNRY